MERPRRPGADSVIDAHLHVWDLERAGYPWLTPELGPLYRSFGPEQAEAAIGAADGVILVQAEDSVAETAYLLGVARGWSRVRGVVGWVDLADPAVAAEQLAARATDPLSVGVRHLVHNDPRPDFLALPGVRASLRLVAQYGLVFDIPDAWAAHAGAVVDLARALPELTIVVDHLGKPSAPDAAWAEWIAELGTLPNVTGKLSGLPAGFEAEMLGVALAAFGADRLMYGGDWPMTLLGDGPEAAWSRVSAALDGLSPTERAQILAGTAERTYSLSKGQR